MKFSTVSILTMSITGTSALAIDRRDATIQCFLPGFGNADLDDTNNLISDLRDNGRCVSAGQTCTRVACGNTSAIWLCNDNAGSTDQDCGVVADMANDIMFNCSPANQNDNSYNGQKYDANNWNVVIRNGDCNASSISSRAVLTSKA